MNYSYHILCLVFGHECTELIYCICYCIWLSPFDLHVFGEDGGNAIDVGLIVKFVFISRGVKSRLIDNKAFILR